MVNWTDLPHLPLPAALNSDTVNLVKFPLIHKPVTRENVALFNAMLDYIREDRASGAIWYPLEKTKSGGVSVKGLRGRKAYGLWQANGRFELVMIASVRGMYHFVLGRANKDSSEPTGRESYRLFEDICSMMNIDLAAHAIPNGKDVKLTIPKPIIRLGEFAERYGLVGKGANIPHVHHLDLNSSHMAGVAEANPDLRPAIEHIYAQRKKNKMYKSVLTHAYGFFQSQWCNLGGHGYSLANLSKDALEFTNRMVTTLAERFTAAGAKILLYNTDGFWFVGDPLEIPGLYGNDLGQYKFDHVDCLFNVKSKGCYQYIENGKYEPVYRGTSTYEAIVPRSEWIWDDIYKGQDVLFELDPADLKVKEVIDHGEESIFDALGSLR